jgi:hypothetical protein
MASRWPVALALAGWAAWVIIALVGWLGAAPLGHDESQYAIAARDLFAGEGPRWWFYLSRGMEVVAAPGVLLGESEVAMRALPFVIGAFALPFALWRVARSARISDLVVGVTLLVLAGASGLTRIMADLSSDVPAAAALLGAIAVLTDEVDRPDGARWRIVVAAPLLAAALYLRYGSALPIAVIVVAAIAVGARTLVRRPWPVIVTAVVFLVLLVPHFLSAIHYTGSPLGILLAGPDLPSGLVTYLTSNPFTLYGYVIPFVLIAGLVSLRIADRRRLLLWLVAAGTLVAVGLVAEAQPRYVLTSLALLALLGVDRLQRFVHVVAIAAAIVAVLVIKWRFEVPAVRVARIRGTLAAAQAIRADANGAPCTVFGAHFAQLEWYSRCRAPLVMDAPRVLEAHARGEAVYVVRDYVTMWRPAPQPDVYAFPGDKRVVLVKPLDVEVVKVVARQPP